MSEFHYVRTRGPDGGVDACEGPAIGLDLETVLKDGLPPWKIALEVVAALCEILDIADEDGEIHGEVHPKYVFIDETGAVSLEGFGVKRKKARAPEGVPKDTRTDLYGLGYTAFRCFCTYTLPDEVPTDDADTHDDMVVDAALQIDLSAVDGDMQGDIQWFVAKLMGFDREDRPTALEAWRTFVAFAAEAEGPDMAEWCAAALDGGGARRTENQKKDRPEPEPQVAAEDELGGPSVHKGPMSGRPVNFEDGGGPAKGGATAFWTRDEMKKALEKVHADEQTANDEGPPMGIGGGSATSFWSAQQLAAMKQGGADAPRPRRAEGEAERRKTSAAHTGMTRRTSTGPLAAPAPVRTTDAPRPVGSGPPPPPLRASGSGAVQRSQGPVRTTGPSDPQTAPPPQPPPQVHPDPSTGPLQQQGPNRAVPSRPPPSPPQLPPPSPPQQPRQPTPAPGPARPVAERVEEDEGGGGLTFVLFGGGIAAFGGAIAVLLVIAVLVLVLVVAMSGDSTAQPAPSPAPPLPIPTPSAAPGDPEPPSPTPSPGVEKPSPRPSPGARPSPSPRPSPTPRTSPSPSPRPSPSPPPSPTPRPGPKPVPPPPPVTLPSPSPSQPAPPGSDARVQIRSSGRGQVQGCSEGGSSVQFDGLRNFVVPGYQLPATCLVTIDGARAVFQVTGSGDITCEKQGTIVVCDKSTVP